MTILGAVYVASIILTSCGPSACDCAKLKGDQDAFLGGVSGVSYNGVGTFNASEEQEEKANKTRKCIDKFGSLNNAEAECK